MKCNRRPRELSRMWPSETRAGLLGDHSARIGYGSGSARKRQRLAYHFMMHEPRLRILQCTLEHDLNVVRVDVPSMRESPPMIRTDAEKEMFVRNAPANVDGLLIVLREPRDGDDGDVTYCELLLKSEVQKRCKFTTWSYPTVQELPFDITPPTEYRVYDFVIPKGTLLYHAPTQEPYKDKSAAAADQMRVEGGGPHDHVIYFGLRPVECFSRYTKLIEQRQRQGMERGINILEQHGRNPQLEEQLDFKRHMGME